LASYNLAAPCEAWRAPAPVTAGAEGLGWGPLACYTSAGLGPEEPLVATTNIAKGVHVAARRRAVRPVRRTTTFTLLGATAAPAEGQSTQVPGHSVEGFLVSRGSRRDDRRGEHRREE
jgi:hypothetical protein